MTNRTPFYPMPYAVSPSPTSPSPIAFGAQRLRKPRFGIGQTPGLSDQQLDAYQAAILKSFPDLQNKYGTAIDMKDGYNRLFFEVRNKVAQTAQKVSPGKIIDYGKRGLFGHVEEATDAMFELQELRVIQNKWITETQAKRWANLLQECRKDNRSFEAYFEQIQNELPESSVENFREMSGLAADQSKQMLALIGGKFGQFYADHPKFNMLADTKPLLSDEIKEFFEHEPRFSVEKAVVTAAGWLCANIPLIPASAFDKLMLHCINRRTGMQFQMNDVTPLSFYKFANRQCMQYDMPGKGEDFKTAYNFRKTRYKGYEVLLEAGIINTGEQKQEAQKGNMKLLG